MRYLPRLTALLPLLLALGSCTVYMPTMPSTPLLGKGQVQVSAGIRGVSAVEAGAAYSPVNHVLLSAEGALGYTDNEPGYYHRQLSLGAGGYVLTAKRTYLAALGGVGVAGTRQDDPIPPIFTFGAAKARLYEARYQRYYAQVYAAQYVGHGLGSVAIGGSLRTVWTSYSRLTVDELPFAPDTKLFFEPMVFAKFLDGPVQVQTTAGISLPQRTNPNSLTANTTAPVSLLLGVTLIFRLDLLKSGQQF